MNLLRFAQRGLDKTSGSLCKKRDRVGFTPERGFFAQSKLARTPFFLYNLERLPHFDRAY